MLRGGSFPLGQGSEPACSKSSQKDSSTEGQFWSTYIYQEENLQTSPTSVRRTPNLVRLRVPTLDLHLTYENNSNIVPTAPGIARTKPLPDIHKSSS